MEMNVTDLPNEIYLYSLIHGKFIQPLEYSNMLYHSYYSMAGHNLEKCKNFEGKDVDKGQPSDHAPLLKDNQSNKKTNNTRWIQPPPKKTYKPKQNILEKEPSLIQ